MRFAFFVVLFYNLTRTFLRYDPVNPGNPSWLIVDGNDAHLIDPLALDPERSYEKYVLDMLGKMVLAEEAQYGAVSGLRLFGRWDVSVCRHKATGKYQYFVNEVTRSWDTCLSLCSTHSGSLCKKKKKKKNYKILKIFCHVPDHVFRLWGSNSPWKCGENTLFSSMTQHQIIIQYLLLSKNLGICIVFWIPLEHSHTPITRTSRQYAYCHEAGPMLVLCPSFKLVWQKISKILYLLFLVIVMGPKPIWVAGRVCWGKGMS